MENIQDNIKTDLQSRKEYRASLAEYEGPLDILLHFVKEEELNIYDIPISKITKDFLDYIKYMQTLDIELAGEFLLMASELMKIKARMLIPSVTEDGELTEEDPRATLVRKLLEYKRFKDMSEQISKYEEEARKIIYRGYFNADAKTTETDILSDLSLRNLTLYNLISEYKKLLEKTRRDIVHPIEIMDVTPESQRDFLIKYFSEPVLIKFDELTSNMSSKLEIICTFLAMLQLTLEGYIQLLVDPDEISNFSIFKSSETT